MLPEKIYLTPEGDFYRDIWFDFRVTENDVKYIRVEETDPNDIERPPYCECGTPIVWCDGKHLEKKDIAS